MSRPAAPARSRVGARVELLDGTVLELLDARHELDFHESEGGRWVTICRRHGAFVQHETRSLARDWLPHAGDWCEGCAGELVDRGNLNT